MLHFNNECRLGKSENDYTFFSEPANGRSSNFKSQRSQRDLRTSENQQLKITIDQNASRLFNVAWVCIHK